MPDDLTLAEVERVAALARLALTGEEKSLYLGQLARILDYARQISDLDTGGVPPTASVLDAATAPRADQVRPSLGAAERAGQRAGPGVRALPRAEGPGRCLTVVR